MKALTLPIRFRVVAATQCNFTLQQFHQGLPKTTCETRVPITYYFCGHAKFANPIFKEQPSHVWRCYIISTRHKIHIFRKTINNGKDTSVPTCSLR